MTDPRTDARTDPSTIVWISGASSGIGRALTATVPWPDARVIDISRTGSEDVEHVAADLVKPTGWKRAAESFLAELDTFDGDRAVFIHCAGTLHPMGFAGQVDPTAYARQVLLNSASPQVLGDAFLRAVDDRDDLESHLVMISSGAATSVYEGWSAYGAGKAAVDHWVRIAGAERARRGSACRVVAVAPGVVETPMQEQIRQMDAEDFPQVEKFIALHERGELRTPEDAARGIWGLFERPLDNGAVVDLRELD